MNLATNVPAGVQWYDTRRGTCGDWWRFGALANLQQRLGKESAGTNYSTSKHEHRNMKERVKRGQGRADAYRRVGGAGAERLESVEVW